MGSIKDQARLAEDFVDPDYWFGVTDGVTGALWPALYDTHAQAMDAASDLEGRVVLVCTRIAADAEGEYLEPKPRHEVGN